MLASHYCTGTLGSYDVERSFSTYNSILDPKRRNLNEQTLKALHFLNWNLKVKNSIREENLSPQQKHVKKVSRHLNTKLTCPNSFQEKSTTHCIASSTSSATSQQTSVSSHEKGTTHHIASSTSSATSQQTSFSSQEKGTTHHIASSTSSAISEQTSVISSQEKGTTHHIASSTSSATSQQTSVTSQEKGTFHDIASSSSGATKRMSLKDALKRKSANDLNQLMN